MVLTGLATICADAGESGPPEAWTGHARSCLEDVFSVEARFTQEIIHSSGKAGSKSSGKVMVKRGQLMRLEYDDPAGALVVSDGKILRSWNPETKTVYETPAKTSPLWGAFAFVLSADPPDDLRVRFLGGAASPETSGRRGVLELVPSRKSTFSRVLVTLEPTCPPVKRVTIVDLAGTATRITLDDYRTNVGMKKAIFSFATPKGARVVRP